MTQADSIEAEATFHIKNIGGIEETDVGLSPGISVLEGRNATNRTSFLRAIMAALGSDGVSLKSDAEEGRVALTLGDETYTRTLRRTEDGVVLSGEPYLDDPILADSFAFLLASNPARQAVSQQGDLRELIMESVDTDEIQAEIDRLERERDRIDEQLEELDDLKGELPALEERRTALETDVEAEQDALAEKESEIEAMDAELDDTREQQQQLEERLDELRELRSELENVRSEIELQEESIASLREQRAELNEELESLPEAPMGDVQEIQ